MISRTDSIGDVVLTLPMAGVLKQNFPDVRITFLGRSYTRPVIEASKYVDRFMDREEFLSAHDMDEVPDVIIHVFPDAAIARKAMQLHIPTRIGATGRLYHWMTCNRLVPLSRRRSALHEAQLNLLLLKPLKIVRPFAQRHIEGFYGFEHLQPLKEGFYNLLTPGKYHLILHPKSQGSAREWGATSFIRLVEMLDLDRFEIFISGTEKERSELQPILNALGTRVKDISGKMDLAQFMAFIAHCDGLVACSTGPLHIAAAMGKDAIGLYPPERPTHPGRWAPLGTRVQVLVAKRGDAMETITPESVKAALDKCIEASNTSVSC